MIDRKFNIGDICAHNGFICRVDAVKREIIGVTRPSAYSLKDGTELNPTLTITPLYGPNGEPVKKAKPRDACSGAVDYAQYQIAEWEQQADILTKRAGILRGLLNLQKEKEGE